VKALNQCRILLVDDQPINIEILVQALRAEYRLGVATRGDQAVAFARSDRPDLILLDIMMPGMDGFEVARRLKADDATRHIPIIFITGMDDPEKKTKGLEIGAVDYITKPFVISEVKARVKTHLQLRIAQEQLRLHNLQLEEKIRERTRELEKTKLEIIDRLGLVVEYRDEETGSHIKRMSEYCRLLGAAAGLPPEECETLALASTVHDIGKIGIPDAILRKPHDLRDGEWQIMKLHPTIGARLLAGSRSKVLQAAEVIALTHHERWDGTGYTRGLKGLEIPLYGRIACICDVFDALISRRPYKAPWTFARAMAEIARESGKHFDPELVRLFQGLEPEVKAVIARFGDALEEGPDGQPPGDDGSPVK
jgi:putative two-component system response regulator